jgi:hypothetical protein
MEKSAHNTYSWGILKGAKPPQDVLVQAFFLARIEFSRKYIEVFCAKGRSRLGAFGGQRI